MKTKILSLSMVFGFLFFSCSKDGVDRTPVSEADVTSSSKIDNVSDDVLQIVESQSDQTEAGKSSATSQSFLSTCATVTTTQSGNVWTRVIDFGTTNCQLANGNWVRGIITLTFTNDFTAATRTIDYTFTNFYHNDRHVEGTRNVVKTILPNGHPQATINMNLTITNPASAGGEVITRSGQRVREFVLGYNTPELMDNEFSVMGSWATTISNGHSHSTTITAPVIIKNSCFPGSSRFVSGTLSLNNSHGSAILDYGNGTCDNDATITINGVVHHIILGN